MEVKFLYYINMKEVENLNTVVSITGELFDFSTTWYGMLFLMFLELILTTVSIILLVNGRNHWLIFKDKNSIYNHLNRLHSPVDRKIEYDSLKDLSLLDYLSLISVSASLMSLVLSLTYVDNLSLFIFVSIIFLSGIYPWIMYQRFVKKFKKVYFERFIDNI